MNVAAGKLPITSTGALTMRPTKAAGANKRLPARASSVTFVFIARFLRALACGDDPARARVGETVEGHVQGDQSDDFIAGFLVRSPQAQTGEAATIRARDSASRQDDGTASDAARHAPPHTNPVVPGRQHSSPTRPRGSIRGMPLHRSQRERLDHPIFLV